MYRYFGVMLDCSRNAVLNLESAKKLIDSLQKMGYNALELYAEDMYEVKDEPYFGYLRGRYSGRELKELDAYAAARGVELIPCIQTLAHFTNPVKLPRFRKLTDANDILLIDEEETYEFLDRLFCSLAENFSSRLVNIGMDEAHMVGLGKYLDRHGYCDRFEILNRHLKRVADIAEKYGFRPHMWSDMFFRLAAGGEYYAEGVHVPAEVREKVPQNVALTYWDYYHTQESVYDGMIAAHQEFGRELWFAGGAWSWQGFAPRTRFTYASMKPAMRSIRKHGVENVMITMWGDNGAECPPFSLLQALYAIRRYADGEFDEKKIRAEFQALFGLSAEDLDLLELPNVVSRDECEVANPAKSLLYADPFLGLYDGAAERAQIPYGAYAENLAAAKARAGEYAYLFETQEKLCRLMEKKALLGVNTRRAYRSGKKEELRAVIVEYAEAEKRTDEFFAAFAAQWSRVNKQFGFEVQCARLGGVKQRLAYCRGRLLSYLNGETDRLEELEEELLPFDADNPDCLHNNVYRLIVSTSEL